MNARQALLLFNQWNGTAAGLSRALRETSAVFDSMLTAFAAESDLWKKRRGSTIERIEIAREDCLLAAEMLDTGQDVSNVEVVRLVGHLAAAVLDGFVPDALLGINKRDNAHQQSKTSRNIKLVQRVDELDASGDQQPVRTLWRELNNTPDELAYETLRKAIASGRESLKLAAASTSEDESQAGVDPPEPGSAEETQLFCEAMGCIRRFPSQ